MTLRGLEFFWGYRATRPMRDFGRMSAEEIPAGAEVLINPPEIQRMRDQIGYVAAAVGRRPAAAVDGRAAWDGAALYTVRR